MQELHTNQQSISLDIYGLSTSWALLGIFIAIFTFLPYAWLFGTWSILDKWITLTT